MNPESDVSWWRSWAIVAARVIFAAVFAMAVTFKFADMPATAAYIAEAGFSFSLFLAWIAALFEAALTICFLTGAFFTEAALLAAAYIMFLACAFHGPARWNGNQAEFGFFVDQFTFFTGLLFAAVHGPGRRWALHRTIIGDYWAGQVTPWPLAIKRPALV